MQSTHYPDMQSIQGTLLSVLFIVIAKLFEVVSINEVLQGTAYFATIVVAIDTLSGNQIKKTIINKVNAAKSKRTNSNKKV